MESQDRELELLRKKLLEQINFNDENDISKDFEKKFFSYIEYCILSLIEDGEAFFAHFIIQIKRKMDNNLPAAISSILDGVHFIIYFNAKYCLQCSVEEIKALMKHEVYHIVSQHHIRAAELLRVYSAAAVYTAMDIAINQFIKGLPAWSEKIENVRLSYNAELKDNDTIESYAHIIQESINSRKKKSTNRDAKADNKKEYNEKEMEEEFHNIVKEHINWNSSSLESDPKQYNEAVKKIISSSVRGEIPDSMQKLINKYNIKAELSWEYYLKSMLGKVPEEYKKTSVRRDRRQPERYDIRGRLRAHKANIIVAIDISGSISDQEIEKIMQEVFGIVKLHNVKITIIECDSEIRRIYIVKNQRELLEKINTRGGTKYTPVFDYMSKKKSPNSILIYFTDGIGENEIQVREIHRNTIWVLTGQEQELSVKSPPGVVLKLTSGKKKEMNILALEYLKDEMKEIRSEWAK